MIGLKKSLPEVKRHLNGWIKKEISQATAMYYRQTRNMCKGPGVRKTPKTAESKQMTLAEKCDVGCGVNRG